MKTLIKDPVCGMELEKEKAEESSYKGKDYYFCCFHCKAEFEKDPAEYIEAQKTDGCRC